MAGWSGFNPLVCSPEQPNSGIASAALRLAKLVRLDFALAIGP